MKKSEKSLWRERDKYQRSREELIKRYMPLARSRAIKYDHHKESIDELIGVANLALIKAVDRYDASRGVSFAGYARRVIDGSIKNYFRDHANTVHLPRGLTEAMVAVKNALKLVDPGSSIETIAGVAGLSVEETEEAILAMRTRLSLQMQIETGDGDGLMLEDIIPVEDRHFDAVDTKIMILSAIDYLDDREQTILRMRFEEEMTQKAIAEKFGYSQMHVSRLIKEALQELRLLFEADSLAVKG